MKRKYKVSSILMVVAALSLLPLVQDSAFAAKPTFGMLYYGETVRTLIPPAETKVGLDDLYVFTNSEQLGIASVAPGDKDYHGGHWIVNEVTFNVNPYELTSEEGVLTAEMSGDVTIKRNVGAFLCPIQPN